MKKEISQPDIYRTIVETLGEEIFVSDGEGNVLFVNPASIEINAPDLKNIVGKNVRDLMNEGYFSESSTLKVLQEKKPVSILQYLKNGKAIIASGFPIFDDKGNIEMVVTSSQDIEAVNSLLETMEQQQTEIMSLKKELSRESDFEVIDPSSVRIKASLEKVASLDIPLVIYGESGTGKTIAARHIHFSGKRRSGPFITVNCISGDPAFLEKEIFGYEDISSSGEKRRITQGKIDFAGDGTLVLNSISYMPRSIQSKLFEYIDTGHFTRFNGTHEVAAKARIIAITGMDLKELSDSGMFLKPLYYRLNTVPITIPPLRKRVQDIPYLANQYVSRYSKKYRTNKSISKEALGTLTSYSWPGNLIELDQTIESAFLMTDGAIIKGSTLYEVIYDPEDPGAPESRVYCRDIIPLKEAKHKLEEQLVKRAFDVYGTTHKTAEVLGVNQSTVSRILNKYRKQK
ncbi:MAG: sigma 54-interacting transcriptional regulator [Bacillota bacterium]|nr:sigma 54-interacting transcriptional regulator [Bacillota bacterium]